MPRIAITDYSQQERAAWLRLSRTQRVGPITFYKLLERFGLPSEALAAVPTLSARGKRGPLSPPSFDSVDAERQNLGKLGGSFLFSCDARYPALMRQTPDPSPVLTVLGDPGLLNSEQVGVVGARNASANGIRLATALCLELGARGLTITSGLARGIDAAAHRAALQTGTIAVVAGGVDIIYPLDNEGLYHDIKAGGGAIVSEVPLGVQPIAQSFPKRNRLIAGLSLGTLVIEASKRSGSLITARIAGDIGREVMAIPGSPLDSRSAGTNHILRQGATLITSAEDVMEALRSGLDLFTNEEPDRTQLTGTVTFDETDIANLSDELLGLLSHIPSDINDLIRLTGSPTHILQAALVELELSGHVQREGSQTVALVDDNSH